MADKLTATHTDYKHPKHLRVEGGGKVLCMSPTCSSYDKLNRKGLPSWTLEDALNAR